MSSVLGLRFWVLGAYVILTYGCGPSEYPSEAGECCPMCNMGMVVLSDCHGDYSTACKPCVQGTFMDHPNGLRQCIPCKSCDSQQGLYVLKPCTTMRDTQCGVLDGFYCRKHQDSECTSALKHRECDPGEEIRTPGNAESDTVCVACPPGFYSPLGINCTRWTDCSVRYAVQAREGSAVEDVQCRPPPRQRHGVIASSVLTLAVLLTVACCNKCGYLREIRLRVFRNVVVRDIIKVAQREKSDTISANQDQEALKNLQNGLNT